MTNEIVLIYTVCGSVEEAEKISQVLIHESLAACTNYWPIHSMYMWKNELVNDSEVSMIVKTTHEKMAEACRRIQELHSYELPCILTLSPTYVDPSYAMWIIAETRASTSEDASANNRELATET